MELKKEPGFAVENHQDAQSGPGSSEVRAKARAKRALVPAKVALLISTNHRLPLALGARSNFGQAARLD